MTFRRERVIVIGGGVAGLATALKLAPMPVTVLVQAPLGKGASTPWAQGGIAAALGSDDAPSLHAADTLTAGAGLTDLSVATRVASAAPQCIADLVSLGVPFDRDDAGQLLLGLEAAHSRRRIVHAGGDGTGRAVMETLISAVCAADSIEVLDGTLATDLVTEEGAVVGVKALNASGVPLFLPARAVVLATGGVGGLYAFTTNPLGAIGSGLALAARAGAVLSDIEFVQFHPTAIAFMRDSNIALTRDPNMALTRDPNIALRRDPKSVLGVDPMPLATEALRGEGAVLVNEKGERFMAGIPGAELAPRDVVARAVWREIARGGQVWLDTREVLGAAIATRFPSVTALCRQSGLDPVSEAIPVRPAAHYHMGGVAVDDRGRSSVSGLWACGEVSATGLHGANRLASNSLLEGLAYARWIAEDIHGVAAGKPARPVMLDSPPGPGGDDSKALAGIRRLMTDAVGVVRDEATLTSAIAQLEQLAGQSRGRAADAALTGMMIAVAARKRRESRGAQCRSDYPALLPEPASHTRITLAEARAQASASRVQPSAREL